MPFVILPTNSASGGYNVANSLRFNSGSSDYLSRTPASAGNRQKFTQSFWVKRGAVSGGASFRLFTAGSDGTDSYFGNDALVWYYYNGGYVANYRYQNTALFRDPSAWYHIVFALDSTQATGSNRFKMYVNGVEGSYTATEIPQNTSVDWNNTVGNYIGRYSASASIFYDGYMAEAYNIDGQQLTASSFGETDEDTGIWKPKAYTGSYGTNGFYLQFKNSSSLGTDSSGNGNNFTVNNLTSIDQTTDTPTNNFATLNPLIQFYPTYISTFSNGNLDITRTDNGGGHATIMPTKGKWYAEFKCVTVGASNSALGALPYDKITDNEFNPENKGVAYRNNGNKYVDGTSSTYGSTYTSGDIIGIALNLDVGECIFYKNGTAQNSGTAITGFTYDSPMAITCKGGGSGWVWSANFGNPPYSANSYTDGAGYGNFSYAVPSGYYSLNTKNLAEFG